MKYIVTGRSGSGKSSFLYELSMCNKTAFTECSLASMPVVFEEGDKVVIISTALFLCLSRNQRPFNKNSSALEDTYLTYVTELPNCTIINNDKDIDALKVLTKKFNKSL